MKKLLSVIASLFLSGIFTIAAVVYNEVSFPAVLKFSWIVAAPFLSLALISKDVLDLVPAFLPGCVFVFYLREPGFSEAGYFGAALWVVAVLIVALKRHKIAAIVPVVAGASIMWFTGNVPLSAFFTLAFFIIYFWTVEVSWFRRSIRVFPLLHFPILVIAGGVLGGNFSVISAVAALAFACAWEFATGVNDIFDVDIDKVSNPERPLPSGMASRFQYEEITMVNGLIAIALSLEVSVHLYVIAFIILAYIYSAPPLRLKKYPVGSVFIALGSLLAFYAGFLTSGAPPDVQVLKIMIVMFIAFSCGTVVKDLKDVEGDLRAGVSTIYTVLGVKRGLMVTYFLLAVSFFSPLILLEHVSTVDVVFVSFAWAIASVLLTVSRRPFITFLPYLLEFGYIFLRYIGYF